MRTRALRRMLAATLSLTLFAAACGDDSIDAETGAGDDQPDMSDGDGHEHDGGDMSDGEMSGGEGHDHGESVEFEGANAPTIAIEVIDDPSGGVNVHVITTDYTVAPRSASGDHVEGEGHFHLYVDGEKQLRFYNEWIHVPGVTEGEVEIAVDLSANDHRTYAVDGMPITATELFRVPEHTHDEHSHEEPVPAEFVGPAPTLELEVVDDAKSGWNAFVTLDGMTLSPEHVSGDPVDGEGHLHIYANGQKIGRLYGLASHLANLPAGEVELSVEAFTNDHEPYVVDGEPLAASTTVTVSS